MRFPTRSHNPSLPGALAGAFTPVQGAGVQVALVFAFMLVNYADKAVLGLASVPIMRELSLSNSQFGAVGSAFFLLFAASGVAGGFASNHVPCKALLLGMALAWAGALLPVSWASSVGVLAVSRIALGAAEGPAFPVAMHALYKWFADAGRAVPTSIVASGAAVGTGVIAPAIAWIIMRYGWHAAFGALAGAGVVWAALWQVLGAEGPLEAAEPRGSAARTPYSRLLTSRTGVGVFVAGFAAYWVIALNLVWLANYSTKALHFTPAATAWVVALPALLQILIAPTVAALSQRALRRGASSRAARGLLGSGCVVASGLALIGMALVPAGGAQIVLIGIGFSIGSVIFTLGSTLIGEITPPAQRGAMLGITNSIHTLAGLLAPVAMGMILDGAADPVTGFRRGYVAAGAMVAAFGAIAAVLIDPRADHDNFRKT